MSCRMTRIKHQPNTKSSPMMALNLLCCFGEALVDGDIHSAGGDFPFVASSHNISSTFSSE